MRAVESHGGAVPLAAALTGVMHAAVLAARILATQRLTVPPRVATGKPRSLRIMYVWDDDYPWDVRTEKICATLGSAGHEVHIVARNPKRRALRETLPAGTVHRMRPWSFLGADLDAWLAFPAFFSPRWLALLVSTARHVRPDVIIVRDLPLAPTAIWTGRLLGVPVMIDMAENYPAMLRTLWRAGRQRPLDFLVRNPALARSVERYALRCADRVLVVVEESRDRLLSMGLPPERIDVVSNTPPAARVAPMSNRAPKPASAPVELVYLGFLELPRGIAELIDAVEQVRRSGRTVTLSLIGDGRDAELFRQQAARLQLGGDVVRFRGYLPHQQALEAVAAADVGVVPHQRSPYWDTTIPNKLFDYMAAGLPVVTSDAIPSARVVREARCGEVYRAGDARALAAAVGRLLDPEARRQLGEHGRQAVLERYNWEQDTTVLLNSVLCAAGELTHAS